MLFTPEAEAAEQEFVDAIEKWREAVGLEKFILLGHSLGAFLSCSYAMSYPSRVRHLIMDDPWGVAVRQNNPDSNRKVPIWVAVVASFLTKFNPFTPVRLAGPIGESFNATFHLLLLQIMSSLSLLVFRLPAQSFVACSIVK